MGFSRWLILRVRFFRPARTPVPHFGTLALWHFEWLDVAVTKAAEFLLGLSDGGNGGVEEFGVILEDADDGLGVDGPEFDVVGNVSRVVGFD